MKYSDILADWLVSLGYTTCFYVAGGNIMHLLESCSRKMKIICTVHEVAAGIAAEYFNEVAAGKERAFALVTAGPGLTNIVTAFAGAWLESRELLVLGGQVKVPDLSRGKLRQRGIQEIDGVNIVKPITVRSVLMDDVMDRATFSEIVEASSRGRKGPVFIEIPLDIQGRTLEPDTLEKKSAITHKSAIAAIPENDLAKLAEQVRKAERPLLLIGAGIDRRTSEEVRTRLDVMGLPLTTTWNGADRVAFDHPLYFGRPNTWGMRYSNLVLQQADLLIALGTRLGLQQTGFNWQEFVPGGKVVQVDCDRAELEKGNPKVAWPICGDANQVLRYLSKADLGQHEAWVKYCKTIKSALPLVEEGNTTGTSFVSPYKFVTELSKLCKSTDVIVPCSSGGAFTVMMQTFAQQLGQKMVTNKGLASMGYGLSGAIGAAVAAEGQRTILVEGDGGFSQNLQEIGTVAVNKLNLKIFIFMDNGYASIRMTQSNYFGGRYMGCDTSSGLGLPNWEKLFAAYEVPAMRLDTNYAQDMAFKQLFACEGPAAFIVPVDPKQTYFPKIMSRVTETGGMASNPLHLMSPPLDEDTFKQVGRYLPPST